MEGRLNHDQRIWRWKILFSTYIAYGGYYLTRKVFTICKTSIAGDFGWQLESTAHIWAAFLLAYMIGQFINSFIGRKWGPRVLLLGGLGISICINVVFGFANSFATFLVFMFFNGLVQASGWPGVVGGISHWLRNKERGTIMGFWSTNYVVGNMVVKSAGAMLLAAYGWRYAFWGMTLLTVGVWLVIYFWQRNKPEDVGLDPIVEKREEDGRAVRASEEEHISTAHYFQLAFHPVVLTMGVSYFCIKFLRYALDSWLPAFLNIQGLDVGRAGLYSSIFDWTGLGGAIVAGWALDRIFRGNWAMLCFTMSLGMIFGYMAVIYVGSNPVLIALCFGIVGFMIYGPDTILCGAASVTVAGEANGVAVAGLVNGIASFGPVIQEEVIGWLVSGDQMAGIRNTNRLALGMSVAFSLLMIVMMWRLHITHKGHRERDELAQLKSEVAEANEGEQ